MVQGKPNLTLGGASQATAPSRARASRTGARAAESFAAYLPAAEAGTQGKASPARAAVQNAKQTAPDNPVQSAPASRSAGAQGKARMYLGFLPDNYASGSIKETPAQSGETAPVNLPAGNTPRAEARALARPGTQAMPPAFAANQAAIQQRISPKSGIRLSGRPITGRGNIGMVDTRNTGQGSPAAAGQSALAQAARTPATRQTGAVAPRSGDAFSRFSAPYEAGVKSAQSFVEHGFSSKNAQKAMRKLGYDLREQPSLTTYATRLEPDPYGLKAGGGPGTMYGSTKPLRFADGEDGARTAVQTASHRKRAGGGTSLVSEFQAMANQGLGNLAAKFESGADGIAAIGYDRKGGTSYGKYQIASRVGTMRSFLNYLQDKAPDLAKRLESAGPANTGGRRGGMPTEWRNIAAEDPTRFEALQSDFIRTSHFEPAIQSIAASTGVSFDRMPPALQEVLFSTAVQHGPAGATRIVSQALKKVDADKLQSGGSRADRGTRKAGEQLITQIYNLRAGQFMSSSSKVQSAVRNRLQQEMREALQMLT